jgi:pyruvate dehydrogenase E2 component (dihydrolipoamide acetyltransferase)
MGEMIMPKLSDTMEEGTILTWLVPDGTAVTRGQQIVEIETDKAEMTVEAAEDGALHILAAEGAVLPIGTPIGWIGEGAPPASTTPPHPEPASAEAVSTNIPVGDDGTPQEMGIVATPAPVTPPAAAAAAAETPELPAPTHRPDQARVIASPLARKIAQDAGIDLAVVHGTGPGGRIVRADVAAVGPDEPAQGGPPAPAVPPAAHPGASGAAPLVFGTRTPATRLQRTIARRMRESASTAPHFALQRDVETSELIALRRQIAAARPELASPTVTDLIIRALAIAAAERPDVLARWDEDAFVVPDGIHIGVAVAVDRGLLVPVIRDAQSKSATEIADITRDLATRCRNATITPAELEGSTITISNLGMFGIDRFTAIINPPEAAILAVGAARPQAVVRDGQIVVRDMMTLTLSVDHRSLYGADGATFLGRLAQLLEMPYALVAG